MSKEADNWVEYTADYQIVSARSAKELTEAVKKIVHSSKNEWEPYEAPFVGPLEDGTQGFHQAMIVLDEVEVTE